MQTLFYMAVLIATGLLFGKLAKYVKLPSVTGYLVGGLLIGPGLLNIIPSTSISGLTLISNVALGFIAFSIGNEMKISYFKRAGARPIVIAFFEATLAVLVTLVALLLYFLIAGKLDIYTVRFSLVLAAIAAATAPAATMMVVRQYKAKGELTQTLMSVVAIDDGIAIALFGIFVAIANALVPGQSVSVFIQILTPFFEIIISLAIGLVFGILLSLGTKWFKGRGNRISLTIAMLFFTMVLAELSHGSSLLAGLMLGAVFANTSPNYEDVNGLIYFITPPIFIMFFVLSGAELNLSVLSTVGILGFIYVIFRVVGKVFGSYLGARITHASDNVRKYLGYALIPQAGVAIGLSLIATQVLEPTLGSEVRAIILAATLIYELTGPIITKIALTRAGEIEIKA